MCITNIYTFGIVLTQAIFCIYTRAVNIFHDIGLILATSHFYNDIWKDKFPFITSLIENSMCFVINITLTTFRYLFFCLDNIS